MDLEPAAGTFPAALGASRNKTSCKCRVTAGFPNGMLLLRTLGVWVPLGMGPRALLTVLGPAFFIGLGCAAAPPRSGGGLWEGFPSDGGALRVQL